MYILLHDFAGLQCKSCTTIVNIFILGKCNITLEMILSAIYSE